MVVGSGPNGLAAGITLQQEGLSVLILEAKSGIGGGLRTEEITIPGFRHDLCSAVHPLAVSSPFFNSLPLADFGLKFLYPEIPLAHPFDDGSAIQLLPSLLETAKVMGEDSSAYLKLMQPMVESWPVLQDDVLGPLHFPKHPLKMSRFGWRALSAASRLVKRFHTEKAKGFWGGLAVHSQLPFNYLGSSAIGLVLLTVGHIRGWPMAEGGSQSIADALVSYFKSIGGKIETNHPVKSLDQLPTSQIVLLDVGPQQLLEIAGNRLSSFYRWQLKKYRYGMGVFKIDWALADCIPFKAESVKKAGTIHIGGTFNEIAASELAAWNGNHSEKPAVLLAQPSVADPLRAPRGQHTGWAYCHVPSGSTKDLTEVIEKQVERFAPGFRERILARHTINTEELEELNANYIRGDIGGGANNLSQLFTRPALRSAPYRSSVRGIYLCSASTPPGGGVHGMCGYHAAKRALRDEFRIII
ncbi:MAG TPA: NAD(P)/FAD-dependent oxidoreductase [Puia sp.]|nr:NAD(P)/FAD-dependent oxidoreductase [Puia sp.]